MAAGILPIFSVSNISVRIDASGTKAVAKYDTLVKLSVKGQTMASQRCNKTSRRGRVHPRISASISATPTGTPRLISSQPASVTMASSSMRIPML